jgi:glycosyltransferase involved in cell wall biosynthesis
MNPFFSICIPNYNYAHYLKETVDSVLLQDFNDFEIIIVDNCSTDDSWDLINSFVDTRIRKFKNEFNIGFAPNLQVAISKANGKFIHLLSADDKMKFGILKLYHTAISQQPNQSNLFILSDISYIDKKSIEYELEERDIKLFQSKKCALGSYTGNGEILEFEGLEILKKVLPNLKNPAPFLSVMVSSELLHYVEGFNAVRTIGPDKFLNYKILFTNPKVLYIRTIGFQYRIHQSENMNAQANNVMQQIDDYLNILYFASKANQIGVKDSQMIKVFLNRVCYKNGLIALQKNNRVQALRMLGSMLFFPNAAIRNLNFYLLCLFIIFYPISFIGLRILYRIKK